MTFRVTDHAILRYLERAKGFDIESVRKHIEQICAPAVVMGSNCVRAEGVRFEIVGDAVVTVSPSHAQPNRTSQKMTQERMRRPDVQTSENSDPSFTDRPFGVPL